MQIGPETVVTFHYTLRDEAGTQLETSRGGDPAAEGRQRRHPRARGRRVRRGTTIMIVILLVLILGAALAQFVLRLGP